MTSSSEQPPEHGRFRDKENPEMMHEQPKEQQQPKEYNKPGCFGAFGKGKFAHLRDCAKGYCQWEPRCKQSQEDY
jgi:hypothetical protein